mmetsp:Transcript_8772/g.12423  ORF Transcript_8772/g.12423 Transcript_8772/m.12423 type:complete len:201 (+) Transcript_8772:110-712(+)
MFSRFKQKDSMSSSSPKSESSSGGNLRRKWVSTPDFRKTMKNPSETEEEDNDDPMMDVEEEDTDSTEGEIIMVPVRAGDDTTMHTHNDGMSSSTSSSTTSGSTTSSRSSSPKSGSTMKKVVSFSTFNNLHKIPSRHELNLISDKSDIWYEKRDVSTFARNELSRRQNMGITSTGMLCSSVPCYDDDDDHDSDDEDMGVSF